MTHVPPRRSPISILLHWLTLLLLAVLVAAILVRDDMEGKPLKLLLLNAHRSLGLLVLGVLIPRFLLWLNHEIRHGKSAEPNLWLRLSAFGAHFAIFGFLFVLPVLGWMASSARGQTVSVFGLIPLPPLTGMDTDYADDLVHYHEVGAWILGGLVTLHVAAALWHHFIRGDHVLVNMLPKRFVKTSKQELSQLSQGES
ncbi:cytochrome b561 [Fluviicoccus keumensis]|uniref:Cytochrome b561 n=1 Tax=Fluviicoccus keumensis TaxID=1435465 RepID=A0A4Q7ZCF4_9GAMM|nr:cytochrome b/b6 domain-containing protein [Fluviicoccus keumensis]RZU47821.1 cytochrome b561 [Fluviicoccus keumensis]